MCVCVGGWLAGWLAAQWICNVGCAKEIQLMRTAAEEEEGGGQTGNR